jgi:hypothetical protein
VLLIPAILASLIASDEQNGVKARIKNIEHPIGAALMLNAQLSNVVFLRARDVRTIGEWKHRPFPDQQQDNKIDTVLFPGVEADPPNLELIGEFHFPNAFGMTVID